MNMKSLKIVFASIVLATSFHLSATVIASTDFDSHTVVGNTASNLTWDINGISSQGNLCADFDLYTTSTENNLPAIGLTALVSSSSKK